MKQLLLRGAVAVISTVLMLTRLNLAHALLYLIVSLLAVSVVFFVWGALCRCARAIVYAGAIMVLFLFVVMMLNIGRRAADTEEQWLTPGIWTGRDSGGHLILKSPIWPNGHRQPGHNRRWTAGSRDRLVWSLHDWCGTGLHALVGGIGGCISRGHAKPKNRIQRDS
jgi:hypothetical protein